MTGERIGNSNQFLQISGVVSAPAYSWASDNDTGLYRIGANNIGVAASGAKVLDISSAGLTVTGLLSVSGNITTPTFAAYRETTVTNATVTGTFTVDMAVANIFNLTQTGSTTYTFSNPAAGGTTSNFLIAIKQGGAGSYTATWPGSVKFPNGSTPVLSTTVGKVDILNFITFDGGTTYFGSLSLANM
jgi:hypothetical protein